MKILRFWSARMRRIVVLATVTVFFAANIAVNMVYDLTIAEADYYRTSCQTGSQEQQARLTVLLVTAHQAGDIASRLCQSESISKAYGSVDVSWKPRTQLSSQELITEAYDVIWSREHVLIGLVPNIGQYYDPLLHFDHYSVYWLSLQNTPVLTAEYFQEKRIGLLADKNSHTHYLLPLESLHRSGIASDSLELVHFQDTNTLYQSFQNGEIDLITGGSGYTSPTPVYSTLIDDDAIAASFFVRQALSNQTIRCELIHALSPLKSLWQGIALHQSVPQTCP
ncbi:hypothetical protein [Pseudohongiella nitratireducens]|uniref:hypothetical protein n=1 Tax=Pseudohongiella nitratireducens TaxID=1768907 RepID=UPI0012FE9F1B|nr:hypothetical protein [Pseudohongiella nitratireducens]MDF1622153.1 hypothetical protein [Pseudohongiella nitratireducens]